MTSENFRRRAAQQQLFSLLTICVLLVSCFQAFRLEALDLNPAGRPVLQATPGPTASKQGTAASRMSPEKLRLENAAGTTPPADPSTRFKVLILGDSLSLCGFGKHLDQRFRGDPRLKAVFTYMACGTIPLSWLKQKPFVNAKTPCGFWSIESIPGAGTPKEFQDTYGMRRGSRPRSHIVPKLEDLLLAVRPQILVMQTGSNLFDLFRDRKTVQPARQGAALKTFIQPFISEALNPSSPVQRLYWVGAPTSGRVSREIQDFVLEQVRSAAAGRACVIDSRPFVSYPYRHMAPDHEHFFGEQMDQWADKVFEAIEGDLSSRPLSPQGPPEQPSPPAPASSSTAIAPAQSGEKAVGNPLCVSAVLVFKSKPMRIDQLLPYQESLVAYVYDVREVLSGEYEEKQILVMHPAHVGLKVQPLDKYVVGNTYTLRLHELEGTAWGTVKSSDDSGRIDLVPYIQTEDEVRFP